MTLAIEKTKAYGKILVWKNLDRLLAEGKITQAEYDEYYPYDGLENSYYSVFVETDLRKASTLIKRGIELVYAEVYGEEVERTTGMSDANVSMIAEAVANVLKPELEKMFLEHAVRDCQSEIPEAVSENVSADSVDDVEPASATETKLPSQTFSFLKGLNDD